MIRTILIYIYENDYLKKVFSNAVINFLHQFANKILPISRKMQMKNKKEVNEYLIHVCSILLEYYYRSSSLTFDWCQKIQSYLKYQSLAWPI